MLKKTDTVRLNKVVPRVEAPTESGLTSAQVSDRLQNGYANSKPISAEKTFVQILKSNIFTYFNLIFAILALCVILVGSYNNLTFMPIIITNCVIGIIQEVRSRRALAKLTFVSAQNATVIRDRKRITIPATKTVLDDIVIFSAGNQIYADAIVVSGECTVNEALVTGEADEITKVPGDTLLSGSFIVSGDCYARLDKVGSDSFVSQLTIAAKKADRKYGGMVAMLQRLVQIIGIIIIPLGIALFIQQMLLPDATLEKAVVSTVAALVGMIPEGLYLLVSVALTVSVLRLARKRTLVHEMRCVESLARVDVLCVDKTGTITESKMDVKGIASLNKRYNDERINMLMADYVNNMPADNETMNALKTHFQGDSSRYAVDVAPFSSAKKYSGVSFGSDESYLMGAPEKILLSGYENYRNEIEKYSSQGYRVLLLASYRGDISATPIAQNVTPLALIMLSNRVREAAPKTFRFFKKQGVKIIVISGDNPVTVSHIAHEAGIDGADLYIDATVLTTDRKIKRAINNYVIFGRVTPDQKRKLVRALKAKGHTVAMTGDGVNDVLALKDADCSIAMASGSEVAAQISDIVLLNSDFSAMPSVVMEGRRVINNIERSAALFLVRNIFSFLLAIATMILALPYPLSPAQLSLIGGLLIGIPSFVLALEPNHDIVRGKFLVNVVRSALPAGLTDTIALIVLLLLYQRLGIPSEEMSTIATIIIAFVGFLMLYKLCRPLNSLRITLIVSMLVAFVVGGFLFSGLFDLSPLSGRSVGILIAFCAACAPMMFILSKVFGGRKYNTEKKR